MFLMSFGVQFATHRNKYELNPVAAETFEMQTRLRYFRYQEIRGLILSLLNYIRSFLKNIINFFWIPPRIQAFEFCDQPWFKGTFREAYMDGINFLFKMGRIYHKMYIPFTRWSKNDNNHVLDLGSGGAGPIGPI